VIGDIGDDLAVAVIQVGGEDDVEVKKSIDEAVIVFLRVLDVGDHSIEGVVRIIRVERIAQDDGETPNIPDRTAPKAGALF
jgi:hypothetical protein